MGRERGGALGPAWRQSVIMARMNNDEDCLEVSYGNA